MKAPPDSIPTCDGGEGAATRLEPRGVRGPGALAAARGARCVRRVGRRGERRAQVLQSQREGEGGAGEHSHASITRVGSACIERTLSGEPAHALACRVERLPPAHSSNADAYIHFPNPKSVAGRYQCSLPASASASHPPLWLEFNIRVVRTSYLNSRTTCTSKPIAFSRLAKIR